MDHRELSESDKYLLYGLLLKKKLSGAQERKVLGVVRSSMDLGAKIQAILRITRARLLEEPGHPADEPSPALDAGTPSAAAPRPGKRRNALVVDARAEVARLLRKCSLRRELSFSRIGERWDAVHLLPVLRARLIVVNEVLPSSQEYDRYLEICRAVEPGIRIIFLGKPPFPITAGAAFEKNARVLPKPLNIDKLEQSARELLAVRRESAGSQAYKAESSR